jgi:hypothetical protein
MEDGIHEGCEYCQGITQPKWHHQEFIQAIPSSHSRFFNIFIYYVDLIVLRFEMNLVKLFGPIELIQQVVDVRHMIVFFMVILLKTYWSIHIFNLLSFLSISKISAP